MEYKGRYRQTDAGKRVKQLEAELQTMRTRMKHMKRTLNSILNQDVISREALLKALDEGLEAGKITDMVMVEQLIYSMPAANFLRENNQYG